MLDAEKAVGVHFKVGESIDIATQGGNTEMRRKNEWRCQSQVARNGDEDDSREIFPSSLTLVEDIYIQAGLLYTNTAGERKIRVMTRKIPLSSKLEPVQRAGMQSWNWFLLIWVSLKFMFKFSFYSLIFVYSHPSHK